MLRAILDVAQATYRKHVSVRIYDMKNESKLLGACTGGVA